jgi:PRTRC genetic system protein A
MKPTDKKLFTPIHLKLTPEMQWPKDEAMFHVLASNGLYRCRNTPFYSSSVLATDFPSELAAHDQFLKLTYPKIPQRTFEKIIGYFWRVGARYGAEAAVLLAWNKAAQRYEIVVPEQLSLVSTSWHGRAYPIEVHYEIPSLPADWMLVGDIHSHVEGPAYASYTDKDDELHRPGLHVVVGRIHEEPPEFHIEVSVDGARFKIKNLESIVEGYHHRRTGEVPQEWLDKVTVKTWSNYKNNSYCNEPGASTSHSTPLPDSETSS